VGCVFWGGGVQCGLVSGRVGWGGVGWGGNAAAAVASAVDDALLAVRSLGRTIHVASTSHG
jgi:hypothetical protein